MSSSFFIISAKWQSETKLCGKKHTALCSPFLLVDTDSRCRVVSILWFWCWCFLEILLVLLLQTEPLSNSNFNWQGKVKNENVKENWWKLQVISTMEFLDVSCILTAIVRIFFNLFHVQSGLNKLGERRRVGSAWQEFSMKHMHQDECYLIISSHKTVVCCLI